jgi:hypothetical protein
MDPTALSRLVETHPTLRTELRGVGRVKIGVLGDAALIAFLAPLLAYVLARVGLPWARPEGCFPPALFLDVLRGIALAPELSAIDPDKAARVAERLMRHLETVDLPERRSAWAELARL